MTTFLRASASLRNCGDVNVKDILGIVRIFVAQYAHDNKDVVEMQQIFRRNHAALDAAVML